MIEGKATAAALAHAGQIAHGDRGFLRTYVFSTDHKMIGRQFLFPAAPLPGRLPASEPPRPFSPPAIPRGPTTEDEI